MANGQQDRVSILPAAGAWHKGEMKNWCPPEDFKAALMACQNGKKELGCQQLNKQKWITDDVNKYANP